MNQQKHPQQAKRYATTNKNNKPTSRKRSHSSSSSTSSSGSPTNNLFSTASSSDSGSSSMTSIKSSSIKKKRNTPDIGHNSSSPECGGNTSSPQIQSITHTSFTPSALITPRLTAQRSVPAFLNKLYNMVEDLSTNDLIRWSKDGSSFIVEKHEEFAKTVLPRFYKHNTFASFVRQLNMYDFHKVPHLQQGVLIAESEHEIWEFSNPHFQKGRPDLLVLVTRKRNKDRDTVDSENISLSAVVQDLATVKKYQSTIGTDLRDLHRDNEILWQETLNAREKHQRHQEAIEKILQFLTAIFANDHLAINMNNTESLPKGLIEEAASLAGMSAKPDEATSNKLRSALSSSPASSSFATSSLSNILSSVLRLYSNNPAPPTPPEQQVGIINHEFRNDSDSLHYPHSKDEMNDSMNAPTLIDFSKTLNSATRSAQTISQDIDMLQVNIESLASNLGIDSSQFDEDMEADRCFQDNYSSMMNSANSADRAKLFAIAASNADLDKRDYAVYDHNKKDSRAMNSNQFNFDIQNNSNIYQQRHSTTTPYPMRSFISNDNSEENNNTTSSSATTNNNKSHDSSKAQQQQKQQQKQKKTQKLKQQQQHVQQQAQQQQQVAQQQQQVQQQQQHVAQQQQQVQQQQQAQQQAQQQVQQVQQQAKRHQQQAQAQQAQQVQQIQQAQRTSDGSYGQLLSSMNYSDSYGTNYPGESTANSTDFHSSGNGSNNNNSYDRNSTRSMNTNYYNNSATTHNSTENILTSGTTASEYNAMVNEYGDIMRPSYFNTATNSNDNYNDL